MLKKLLPSLLAIIFISLPIFISPPQAKADNPEPDIATQLGTIYCERRQGNQMNLETWYGGKCDDGSGSVSLEETIGFGDIILLDLLEKTAGSQTDNGQELDRLLRDLLGNNNLTPSNLTFSTKDGALQSSAKAISFLYQKTPASSIDYLAYVHENITDKKIVKPAYAQEGYGFQALQPILPIWKAFRNVAYFFFIIAFIAYGFMIMFRVKINPQTVISIQLALPKLITTLLLITFSYAIVGLIIDVFYLILGLMLNLLIMGGIVGGFTGFFSGILNSASAHYTKLISGYGFGINGPFLMALIHLFFGGLISKLWSAIFVFPPILVNILSKTMLGPLSIIISLIIAIALLYTFFKIFWMLLKSYIMIILNIIFSPIILLGNIFPGSKSFGNWIKNILAELSIFASTMFMFVLAFYFIGPLKILGLLPIAQVGVLPTNDPLWMPPPLVGQFYQDFGLGFNSEGWFAVIGLGMLLMIPKLAEMIKNALQIKDYGYGSALGDALKFGTDPFGARKAATKIGGSEFGHRVLETRAANAGNTGIWEALAQLSGQIGWHRRP